MLLVLAWGQTVLHYQQRKSRQVITICLGPVSTALPHFRNKHRKEFELQFEWFCPLTERNPLTREIAQRVGAHAWLWKPQVGL